MKYDRLGPPNGWIGKCLSSHVPKGIKSNDSLLNCLAHNACAVLMLVMFFFPTSSYLGGRNESNMRRAGT